MKNAAFAITLTLTTMIGAGCSRAVAPGTSSASATASGETVAQSTNPCTASMSWGTGVHRYFGDCDSRVRIITGW